MATYQPADPALQELMKELCVYYMPHLLEAGVKIMVMEARAERGEDGQPKGPALRHAGYPALALAQITSHKNRAGGMADALIIVDADALPDWTPNRLKAILHHELTHFELKLDEEGNLLTDKGFRPRLWLRPHDRQIGGFDYIAELYGDDSPEMVQVKEAAAAWSKGRQEAVA